MEWVELAEGQVGGAWLRSALIGQTRKGGVDHKGGGTTLEKNEADLEGGAWRKVGGTKKVEGTCYLKPASKGQMEALPLCKWGK